MNAGSVVGIPWGGGDTQTLPYAKEFILHSKVMGTEKLWAWVLVSRARGLTLVPTARTRAHAHAHEPPRWNFYCLIFTIRKRSCGKIMFSQSCVKRGMYPSKHWGRHPPAGTPPRQVHPPPPDRYPQQVHPPGRYTPWQVHPSGRYTPQAGTPHDSHCSERYASYWNAFLLLFMVQNVMLKWIIKEK